MSLSNTAAFLVIRNDSILYENYFYGFSKNDLLPSNSMAKSFTGTLIRIACNAGKIKSLSEPVTNYLPELLKRDTAFKNITLQHLLDMRSGLQYSEGTYTLKDNAIRLSLRRNLKKYNLMVKIAERWENGGQKPKSIPLNLFTSWAKCYDRRVSEKQSYAIEIVAGLY